MTKTLTAIDLFSGCGGVTEGLKNAGYSVCAAVEMSDIAVETYSHNHPDVRVWHSDIRSVDPVDLRERAGLKIGDLDLVAACAPCQGFSRLSTLNGTTSRSDERNDLVLEVVPFIAALMPRSVMLENVPAAETSHQMTRVRRSLKRLGYRMSAAILDASQFGVPQRRRRYILLASLDGDPGSAVPCHGSQTVREAISHLPAAGSSGDALHDVATRQSMRVRELIASIPKNGGSRKSIGEELQLACHRRSDGFSDVYGRMSWDKPAPTITGGFINPSKGRFLHPTADRAISPREGALLQGFPARYHFSLARGKYAAAEMIGNAVPPSFARVNAEAVRQLTYPDWCVSPE